MENIEYEKYRSTVQCIYLIVTVIKKEMLTLEILTPKSNIVTQKSNFIEDSVLI